MNNTSRRRTSVATHSGDVGLLTNPHESRRTTRCSGTRTPQWVAVSRPSTRRIPVSRQLPCPVCAPHEHHLLPCDVGGCSCRDAPILGLGG